MKCEENRCYATINLVFFTSVILIVILAYSCISNKSNSKQFHYETSIINNFYCTLPDSHFISGKILKVYNSINFNCTELPSPYSYTFILTLNCSCDDTISFDIYSFERYNKIKSNLDNNFLSNLFTLPFEKGCYFLAFDQNSSGKNIAEYLGKISYIKSKKNEFELLIFLR